MTRRAVATVALVAASVVVLATGCADDVDASTPEVERVVVVSLPGVTWDEVEGADLPNLEAFVERAAVGDVSTRTGRAPAKTTAAYLTLGAGTRAVVPLGDAGIALNPDEPFGGVPASELLRRRLGETVDGIAYIPVGPTLDANDDSPFGAEVGLLGDALADAGVRRAVIANADAAEGFPSDEPLPDGALSRSAATALMGSDGIVPNGSVGRDLLLDDAAAPFGRRLDPDAVLATFDESWDAPGRTVALVEASDLARASAYRERATPDQARALRREALEQSDELLGAILERVDPETDAVVVLAPTSADGLGAIAVAAPGRDGGLLRSASTRRDGYVYAADVAPTILQLLGEEVPDSIEGRPMSASAAEGDRTEVLAAQNAAATTRDGRLAVVVPAIIAILALLAAAAARRDRLPRVAQAALGPAAIAALGIVPGTYLATLVDATHTSLAAYAVVVGVVAVVVGAVGAAVERRWSGLGVVVGLGAILATIAGDLLAGAPLQVNSIFGYSMAVAGRFTGLGNLAFALFASSAICLAVVAWERWGSRALRPIAGLFVAVVLLEGLPMLGADVGGVAAIVPAVTLTYLVLAGRRLGWREVIGSLVAAGATVALLGVIDASRPASSQTHLARIGDHLVSGRFDDVVTTLWRRVEASFGSRDALLWLAALGIVAVAVAQAATAARGRPWPRALLDEGPRGDVALVVGLGTLSVLGLVTNDSSVAVPATMLIVIAPVLVLRALAADRRGAVAPRPATAPTDRGTAAGRGAPVAATEAPA